MQTCSMLPVGASKPVWSMALLALLAPARMSGARSSSTTLSPPRAKRRKRAQPTTPPPMTARSKVTSPSPRPSPPFGGRGGSQDGAGAVVCSGLRPQMEGFRPRQVLVADAAQRAAAAGILDADPGQRRVEIVAAVHEPGAGLDPISDADRGLFVIGPDGGGQAIGVVVHQPDRLVIRGDGHDAGHRAEAFLLHDGIRLVEIDQDLRRHIGSAGLVRLELRRIDGGP